MKDTFKFGLKLLGTHVLMMIVTLVFMAIILSLLKSPNPQFIGMLMFTALYLLAMWSECIEYGRKDKRNKDIQNIFLLKGLAASVVLLIPTIIFAVFMGVGFPTVYEQNLGEVIFRLWMSPFIGSYSRFSEAMPQLGYATILFIPLTCTGGYIYGWHVLPKVIRNLRKEREKAKNSN